MPHGGAPLVTATQAGVYFTAFAEQWDGEPRDLANYVTPIAVDIFNGTGVEVRISYADFALTTGGGVRVPALNPFDMPARLRDEHDPRQPDARERRAQDGPAPRRSDRRPRRQHPQLRGTWRRWRRWWWPWRWRAAARTRAAAISGAAAIGYGGPRVGWSGGHYGPGARWGRGFYGVGGLRRWYGVGGLYWGGPWNYGPGYALWVTGWGVGVYGDYGPPPADVFEYALPEGVLEPGSHINGYLFFRKATARDVHALSLELAAAYDARSGAPVGDDRVQLEVLPLSETTLVMHATGRVGLCA